MARRRTNPPWDYLHDASIPSLQSYELSRLNHAANLRRELAALLDQWIEDTAQALLARWVQEDRALPRSADLPYDDSAQNDSLQSELPFNKSLPCGGPPQRAERPIKLARRNGSISSAG